jgi:hypothetical protein
MDLFIIFRTIVNVLLQVFHCRQLFLRILSYDLFSRSHQFAAREVLGLPS